MQFHQNGFRPGDPSIAPEAKNTGKKSDIVDVLIVGCGPAGLTLAAQLSQFPDLSVRIFDKKSGPLEVGQADGIACRSIEMFEAFGFSEKVIKEGYWVNEVTFWRPGEDGTKLSRADRIQDVEDDLSEMPHVILSQARIHDFYLEVMEKSPQRLTPDYNRELTSLIRTDDPDYPVTSMFDCCDTKGQQEVIKARYVVGCDGARSAVRKALGLHLEGQSARQLWGVMDILPRTTFPDIRLKCAIQSATSGSVLIIPREGGYMVRLYIELDELKEGERAADRGVTPDMLLEKAKKIIAPYTLEAAEIAWWSAYEIGQRVCDAFDDAPDGDEDTKLPRIFIAGDACHTHSPKAGQGMNVSMADTFNLGWKLAAVLRGQAKQNLLSTYSEERRAKAVELINFDRDMARLFSAKPKNAAEAELFQQYFQKHGRYTAGVETCYGPSIITSEAKHQDLATGLIVGKRFHSAPVIRIADAKPLQLAHTFKADGRWRLVLFAPKDDDGNSGGPTSNLCEYLGNPNRLLDRYTPSKADIDAIIDVRAVFQIPHAEMDITALPVLLLPTKGSFQLIDYEKAFCSTKSRPDIFDLRGINRDCGVVIIVRPDQYIADIIPFEEAARIDDFFERILIPHQKLPLE